MSKVTSQYKGKIVSEHHATKLMSVSTSHVESKTKHHVTSDAEAAAERAAFLTTAKRNASIMFAKYL